MRIANSAIVAAATLSNRYITDRFLPDKAIDLIDEAAARLKMQVNSKPEELDSIDREIVRLKIEQEALKKESDPGSKDRLKKSGSRIEVAGEAVGRYHQPLESGKGKAVGRAKAQDRARPVARRTRQCAAQGRIPARRRTGLWPHSGAGEEAQGHRGNRRQARRHGRGDRHRRSRGRRRVALDRRAGRPHARRREGQAAAHGGRTRQARHRPEGSGAGGIDRGAARARRPAGPATGRSARSCS